MIAIMKKTETKNSVVEPTPNNDEIIIKRTTTEWIENENGRIELATKTKNVNITRMVNETKKLVKAETAAEKLAEIQKVFSK